nr:MAG TPA: portal protein [Siphoviridae sp. ctHdl3]
MAEDKMQKKVRVTNAKDGKSSYITYQDLLTGVYANLSKIGIRNLESTSETNPTYTKYTKDQLVTYLGNPASYEKQLRKMSKYLFNISNYYRRLIQYFANMPTFSYTISPYGLDRSKTVNANKLKKAYYSSVAAVELMNLPHEATKMFTIAFRDDVYYGYEWETNDSVAFQNLDADYCKISSIEDGVYNFAFDFSYFNSNQDKLPNYPPEFQTMYNTYKTNTQLYKWQELDSTKSICIKVNEHDYIPIPPFVSLFSALADIEDYRAISKNASETNNYKALAMEIPLGDKGEFLIDYNDAKEFYDMMTNVLPPNIGAILTPMKLTDWNFEKSGVNSDTNEVAKAEATFFTTAGVNKILFGGGEDPSATTLNLCTVNDQMIVFAVMRQLERWVNRKLKSVSSSYKFRINFLPVTHYNIAEMHERYLKDATYGMPTRTAALATAGYAGTDYENMTYLENEILGLSNGEMPLKSSNTQSGSAGDEGGRPTNASKGEGLSDAGNVSADRQEG